MGWLEELGPGDRAVYDANCYGRDPDYRIVVVIRVTPTGQIVTRDVKGGFESTSLGAELECSVR
jgi:hypothetical protein